MTHEEYTQQLKYKRMKTALDAAEKGLNDVFYAFQEASTETERFNTKRDLERLRNGTRNYYHRIEKIRAAVEKEFVL